MNEVPVSFNLNPLLLLLPFFPSPSFPSSPRSSSASPCRPSSLSLRALRPSTDTDRFSLEELRLQLEEEIVRAQRQPVCMGTRLLLCWTSRESILSCTRNALRGLKENGRAKNC